MSTLTVPLRPGTALPALPGRRVGERRRLTASRRAHRARRRRILIALALGLVIAAATAGVVGATGARLFVIESPSMGETAPVGTLVVGLPVPSGTAVHTGEIVTYRPPDSTGATYTHRIVAVVPGGYRTRGDINGADDPWVVRASMIETRAVALVPALGWLFRIAPLLACGSAVIWVVSQVLRDPLRRFSFQTIGVSAVLAAAIFIYRPFVGYVLLTARSAGHGLQATVVSTGLLPIRVHATGGGSVHLVTGAVGHLLLPRDTHGHVGLQVDPDLGLVGWSLLIALCLLPTLYTLLIGVHVRIDGDWVPDA